MQVQTTDFTTGVDVGQAVFFLMHIDMPTSCVMTQQNGTF